MALASGTRFGPYEIADQIGKGGMGEVYRATDTTLDRDVAIKVLPESFASDADRVARFEQEAKMLASLNHANIAHIHGLERTDGTTAIVMELVEGPTLADRIEHGPVPPDEALNIAMQIADALEAAHEQGIVHRDLKPANIKLRPDGTVKVLDFGIAKAFEPLAALSGPQSPVMTTPVTQAGIILGTAAYMSPEQARGKQIDQRTDIWAFGCVLYEMLTGQPAFGGEDVPITLARVLAHDTDMDSLPAMISPAVSQTLRLCLQKDPKRRVADIRDVRLAFQGAFETVVPLIAGTVAQPLWRRALPVVAAALFAGLFVGITAWSLWSGAEPQTVSRFAYSIPNDQAFTPQSRGWSLIALSPDGRHFVYNTMDGLYLRSMGELEAHLVPGTGGGLFSPTFSPDGQSLVYWDSGLSELRRIAISGGVPVGIADVAENLRGVSWEKDGTILYGQTEGILRVSENGGIPELIIPTDGQGVVYGPQLLPDGQTVLFSISGRRNPDTGQIVVQSLSTGERTVLVNGGNHARYLPTGHLVYALGGGLFAVAFELDSLTVYGGPVPVVQEVARSNFGQSGVAQYSVSENGTLIYLTGSSTAQRIIAWVDPDGREELLPLAPGLYGWPRVSPDGTRIAMSLVRPEDDGPDVWVSEISRGTLSRVTEEPDVDNVPLWTPEGDHLVFASMREGTGRFGFFQKQADGTGVAEKLLTSEGEGNFKPYGWSPDGMHMVFDYGPPAALNIGVLTIGGDEQWEPLLNSAANEAAPALSPDGEWMAYASNQTGRCEVYVQRFPDLGDRRPISTNGGAAPIWSPDGGTLFYVEGRRMMSVSISYEQGFSAGTPEVLFDGMIEGCGGREYDISRDGQQFLVVKPMSSDDDQGDLVVVLNWFEEVERLAPTE